MKNLTKTILYILIIALMFALAGCKSNPEPEQFSVSYTAAIGGSISGNLSQTIEKGGNSTAVTAIANDDYIFIGWSDGNQNKTRQETNVQENLNLYANFEKKNSTASEKLTAPANLQYEITTLLWNVVDGANGYIIDIDGNTHETINTTFSLASLPTTSVYFIKVKAKGNDSTYTDSEFSDVIIFFAGTSANLKYESINNGEAYEVSQGTETATNIVVAEYYNGKPVVSIGEHAFEDYSELEKITIPNSVINIKDWAFANCNGLQSIEIPNNVVSIGEYGFANCNKLKSLIIPNKVNNIGEGAFIYCTGLLEITIGDGLIEISDWMFGECSSLEKIEIPNNINIVGKYAFFNCIKMAEASMGTGVTEIKEGAFALCSNLPSITISEDIIYIGYFAFGGCDNLTIKVIAHESTPEEWDADWNFDNCAVIWNYIGM